MKKRVQVWMMALLMLLSTVAFSLSNAESFKADETGLTVKLHYQRNDDNYTDWDVWAWPEGGNGAAYAFTETGDKGAIATISVPAGTTKLGFIVRQGGDSWAGKDWDTDRFADLSAYTSGVVNIYVTTGVEAFEVKAEEAAPDNSGAGDANTNTDTNTETKEEPKDLTVQLYYLREDGNYDGWNIWGWYEGEGPTMQPASVHWAKSVRARNWLTLIPPLLPVRWNSSSVMQSRHGIARLYSLPALIMTAMPMMPWSIYCWSWKINGVSVY